MANKENTLLITYLIDAGELRMPKERGKGHIPCPMK